MYGDFQSHVASQLEAIQKAGTFKRERVIVSPQDARIRVAGSTEDGGQTVLNMCANNYLGLAEHPDVIAAAHAALDRWGYGLASVRFICGTQELHKQLEASLSRFLGTDDTILYSSCFDANGGLFETLLGQEDAVGRDHLEPSLRRVGLFQVRFEVRHVVVLVAIPLRLTEPHAVDDARVVQLIGNDGVFLTEQRLEQTAIRIEAA